MWILLISKKWISQRHSPLILLRLHTRITVHAKTAAQQQSNGNSGAWMSQICGEWKDVFIRTLSPIQWVPVQDQGSKIQCVKFWAMKIIPSDRLHQEYLTIDLGENSDWRQLQLPLVRLWERWRGRSWATGADWGRGREPGSLTNSLSHSLTLSLQRMKEQEEYAANSCFRHYMQLVRSSSLFVAATAGRECNIQDTRGRGLWSFIGEGSAINGATPSSLRKWGWSLIFFSEMLSFLMR